MRHHLKKEEEEKKEGKRKRGREERETERERRNLPDSHRNVSSERKGMSNMEAKHGQAQINCSLALNLPHLTSP